MFEKALMIWKGKEEKYLYTLCSFLFILRVDVQRFAATDVILKFWGRDMERHNWVINLVKG